MTLKLKQTIISALILLTVLAGGAYFLMRGSATQKTVKILDYGYSICTQDIPTSACGPYDVSTQTPDGQKITYKVAGFKNRDSKLYDDITYKVSTAKEKKTQVILKVNGKDEIVSVQ